MSDIELKQIKSGYNLNKINDNFETLEDVINDEVLHVTGGNNVLSQNLDMNSKRITNLPAPIGGTEPLRKGDITSDETGATVQYVDDSIADIVPLNIINDLSQAYEFPTVAAYKAFTTAFPVGKIVHLLDRDAKFTVIAGTGTANTFDIIASTGVDQSIDLADRGAFNVVSFGAVGDGITDDYPAVNACIDALPVNGGIIFFPQTTSNEWVLSQSLNFRRKVHLYGIVSHGTAAGPGTTLLLPTDTAGIFINSSNTSLYTTVATDPLLPGAVGSLVERIKFLSSGGSGNFDGVVVRATCEINKVQARGFPRNGIRVHADIGGGADLEGNANGFILDGCGVILNGADGLYVNGNDANVGLITKLFAQLSGGWGVTDTSLIGNTYIGTDFTGNGSGPFNVTSRSTLIGSWEDGGGESELGSNVTSIGSNGATISETSQGFHMNSGVARNAPYTYNNTRGAVDISASLGDLSNDTACLTWGSDTESAGQNSWKLKLLESDNAWMFEFANSSSFRPLTFINSSNQMFIDNGFAGPVFQTGYAVKRGSSLTSDVYTRTLGTAAPVAGTYGQGDIVYNRLPTAGGHIGWVCVTSGTPGTWKTFGAITA